MVVEVVEGRGERVVRHLVLAVPPQVVDVGPEDLGVAEHPEGDRAVDERGELDEAEGVSVEGLVEEWRLTIGVSHEETLYQVEQDEGEPGDRVQDRETRTKHEGDEDDVD